MSCRVAGTPSGERLLRLSAALGRLVAEDRRLWDYFSSDEPLGEEVEVIDQDNINLDFFHWELHKRKVASFLTDHIRAYALGLQKERPLPAMAAVGRRSQQKKPPPRRLDRLYERVIRLVAHSSGVRRDTRLRRERRQVREIDWTATNMRNDMVNQLAELRADLLIDADAAVKTWLECLRPELRELAAACGEVLVEQELARTERERARGPAYVVWEQRMRQTQARLREARKTYLRRVREHERRVLRWRKEGRKEYAAVHIYRKWRRKGCRRRLKKARNFDQLCQACKDQQRNWWHEEGGWEESEQLTLEDAKKFHCQLIRSGKMDVLVDYLTILLKRPLDKTEGSNVEDSHESSEA